jgi:hypothetical protein
MPSPTFWRKQARKYRNLAKKLDPFLLQMCKSVCVTEYFLIFSLF